jgi:hypothetical protein
MSEGDSADRERLVTHAVSVPKARHILPSSPNVQKLLDLIEGREVNRGDELQLVQGLAEAFRASCEADRQGLALDVWTRAARDGLTELEQLAHLFRSLDTFYTGYLDRGKTGERAAYIEALEVLHFAMSEFARLYGCANDECFHWFKGLQQMLEDLNDGVISPVLDCPVQSKAYPTNIWLERLAAVIAVEALCLLGQRPSAAAQRVITTMPLDASENDISSWRAAFKKDEVKNRVARPIYQDHMAWLLTAGRAEIEKDVKDMFEAGLRDFWGIAPPLSPTARE